MKEFNVEAEYEWQVDRMGHTYGWMLRRDGESFYSAWIEEREMIL